MDNLEKIVNAPVLMQSVTQQDLLQDRIIQHIANLEKQIAEQEAHPSEISELLKPALCALLASRKRMLNHLREFNITDQQDRVA